MSVTAVSAGPRRGWRSASTWIGAAIVGIAVICAIFAPLLVPHDPFAQDLGKRLLVLHDNVTVGSMLTEQLGRWGIQANLTTQAANVLDAFRYGRADGSELPIGPGLLFDDAVRSGWTLTVVAEGLRSAGSGLILPFALWQRP